MFLALGMIWTGARLFYGRSILAIPLFAGAVFWLLLAQWPIFAAGSGGRLLLSSVGIAVYTFLTATEIWHDRRARPDPRWRAVVVPLLHASVFLSPVLLAVMAPHAAMPASLGGWFTVLTLATLLYAVGTAFLILTLVQDRTIRLHKDAANTDPLTGLFNRRAFLDYAQRLIGSCAPRGQPVTLLMFDLDHFKSINDRFGHAVGDDALRLFARTASACMRTNDAIGRLGGEEFAAVVPGTDDVAAGIAERIRTAFEAAGVVISGHRMHATVSIGAAWTSENVSADRVLAEADNALYRAKESGRNRLELVREPVRGPSAGDRSVVRKTERLRRSWRQLSAGWRQMLSLAQRIAPDGRRLAASMAKTRSTISPAKPK